jgi:hypothetical protein
MYELIDDEIIESIYRDLVLLLDDRVDARLELGSGLRADPQLRCIPALPPAEGGPDTDARIESDAPALAVDKAERVLIGATDVAKAAFRDSNRHSRGDSHIVFQMVALAYREDKVHHIPSQPISHPWLDGSSRRMRSRLVLVMQWTEVRVRHVKESASPCIGRSHCNGADRRSGIHAFDDDLTALKLDDPRRVGGKHYVFPTRPQRLPLKRLGPPGLLDYVR